MNYKSIFYPSKKKVLLIFLFNITLCSENLLAWDNGGVSNVTIERVIAKQNGDLYFQTDKDLCDSGSNTIGYVYRNNKGLDVQWTQAGADMILSIALAAHLSGTKVKVYADDSGKFWGCRVGALSLERK